MNRDEYHALRKAAKKFLRYRLLYSNGERLYKDELFEEYLNFCNRQNFPMYCRQGFWYQANSYLREREVKFSVIRRVGFPARKIIIGVRVR